MKYQMKTWKKIVLMVILLGGIFGIWALKSLMGGSQESAPRKGKTIATAEDIKGARVGVQLGTTGETYLSGMENDGSGTQIERYNKCADAVEALKQGKLDCVVYDQETVKEYVKKNSSLKILDEAFVEEHYSILLAKGNTKLQEKVNTALGNMKASGTLKQIRDYYIANDDHSIGRYQKKDDVTHKNGVLRMASDIAFPPYEYYENGEPMGIDVDIAYAICDELGYELEINDMDFGAIINAVNAGKADVGISGFTRTQDREKNALFSQDYAVSRQVILINTGETLSLENQGLKQKLYDNFVKDGRYKYILSGLGTTLCIALFAALLGAVSGFFIAVIRAAYEKTGHLEILDWFCRVYVTVFRGTPVVVQLLIIYFVIFSSTDINKIVVAVIAFGMNSSAYVSEIIRSGIMSIGQGQFEAGRSLGLSHSQTMCHIILPQAVKNVLPALGNEFIVLFKETSVCGFIGLVDLTRGAEIIRGVTYEAFLPLFAVAIIYLILVMILSAGVAKLEKRLRKNER